MFRTIQRLLPTLACCLLPGGLAAQSQTIPQILVATTHDVGEMRQAEFGLLPTLDSIISASEVVVRGTVGSPQTALSDDEKSVESEYTLTGLEVLDDPEGILDGPSPTVTFKQVGGSISMYGYTYELIQRNLPPLVQGREYVFILKQAGDTFEAAGIYFGVFEFNNNKLTSIGADNFAPELKGMTAEGAVVHILERIEVVREE